MRFGDSDSGWQGWAVEWPRLKAVAWAAWCCWRAARALRRYAGELERREAQQREEFALEAERLGFPALSVEIRNPENWKGDTN